MVELLVKSAAMLISYKVGVHLLTSLILENKGFRMERFVDGLIELNANCGCFRIGKVCFTLFYCNWMCKKRPAITCAIAGPIIPRVFDAGITTITPDSPLLPFV